MARAVHKRSIVFFGPTSLTFWGYPWNINLVSKDYADFWWINPDWMAAPPTKEIGHPMDGFDVSNTHNLAAQELSRAQSQKFRLTNAPCLRRFRARRSRGFYEVCMRLPTPPRPAPAIPTENGETAVYVSAVVSWAYLFAMSCILAKRNSVSGLKMADVGAGRSGLLFAFSRRISKPSTRITAGNTWAARNAEERFLFHANKVARASFVSTTTSRRTAVSTTGFN